MRSQRRQNYGRNGELLKSCVVAKGFEGEIRGTSLCHAAMVHVSDGAGEPVCVGVERLELEFDGLRGSFWLVYTGNGEALERHDRLHILPGSGTGDLLGISGAASILPGRRFRLDYRLAR